MTFGALHRKTSPRHVWGERERSTPVNTLRSQVHSKGSNQTCDGAGTAAASSRGTFHVPRAVSLMLSIPSWEPCHPSHGQPGSEAVL